MIARGCAASLMSVAALLAQDRPQRIADIAGMRDIDARAPVVIGVHAPAALSSAGRGEVASLLVEAAKERVARADDESRDELGFRLTDPKEWQTVGVDPAGDVAVSLCDPGGFLGLPRETVLLFDLLDRERFARWLTARVVEKSGQPHEPRHHHAPDYDVLESIAWASFGKRCLLLMRNFEEEEEISARMGFHADGMAGVESIGARDAFRLVRAELRGVPSAGFYVRPAEWRNADHQETPRKAEDFETMVALDADGLTVAMRVPPEAATALAEPTDVDLRPIVESFPAPHLVCALRADDPVAAASALFDWNDVRSGLGVLGKALPAPGELRGACGLSWLTPSASGAPFEFAIGLVARDDAAAATLFGRMCNALGALAAEDADEAHRVRRRSDVPEGSEARSVLAEDTLVTVGRRGERVFIGTATGPILAALRGDKLHDSALSFDACAESVLDLAPILRLVPRGRLVEGALPGTLHLRGRIDRGHALLDLRREGEGRKVSVLAEAIALGLAFE